MTLTEEQRKQLEELSRPLIEWINDECHQHVKVIVDCTSAEVVEGLGCIRTDDYIRG